MSGSSLTPDQPLRCVWMDAGMLSFKLCDRFLDCDHCPVDAVFRSDIQQTAVAAATAETVLTARMPEPVDPSWIPLLQPHTECTVDAGLRYSRQHLWGRWAGEQQLMLGLDDFLLRSLPPATSIVLRAIDSPVLSGEPLGWAYSGAFALPLVSPATGRLARRNAPDPSPLSHFRDDSRGPVWLVILDHVDTDLLKPAEECLLPFTKDLECFLGHLTTALRHGHADLGICLNDGGQPVESCVQALGIEGYMDALQKTLISGS